MRKRLLVFFALIVLAPLVVVTGLGAKVLRDDQQLVGHRVDQLLQQRLEDTAAAVRRVVQQAEVGLQRDIGRVELRRDVLRDFVETEPLARAVMVVDSDRKRVFPSSTDRTAEEDDFLKSTEPLWNDLSVLSKPSTEGQDGSGSFGWHAFYWEDGIHLLFWIFTDDDWIVGVEVERMVLVGRVIEALPATDGQRGLLRLSDSRGETVYEWGQYQADEAEEPVADLTLDAPLESWRVEYLAPPEELPVANIDSLRLVVVGGLVTFAVVVMLGATWVIREWSRELRESSQRVSFVAQVSHELRTPLTNIRLYAELLADRLPGLDPKSERFAGIIVSESQRLSRLIANVLTFARPDRVRQQLQPRRFDLDASLHAIVEQFRPTLEDAEIDVAFRDTAGTAAFADPDAVEQIIFNLLGNAIKYAPGRPVEIVVSQDGDAARVRIHDGGPGIPPRFHGQVFQPFFRLRNDLTEGVSGTGIGLAIARQLAEAVGGALTIVPTDLGACFELTLPAEV